MEPQEAEEEEGKAAADTFPKTTNHRLRVERATIAACKDRKNWKTKHFQNYRRASTLDERRDMDLQKAEEEEGKAAADTFPKESSAEG